MKHFRHRARQIDKRALRRSAEMQRTRECMRRPAVSAPGAGKTSQLTKSVNP
jgi:hypothetical protein